jgi:non-specific serine/threonine protein kinase
MDPDISFGRWLHWRRRTLDLTQDALARRVGCSVVTIRKLEADERRPSVQVATRLADSLEVATADRLALIAFARAEAPPVSSLAPPSGGMPWRAPPRPPSNLPIPLTPLIGRTPEVAAVRNALRHDGSRLLTLIGPPGIGKTRLGLAVAAEVRDTFVDGVYVVLLASISDPALVMATIAQVLGVHETGDQPLNVLLVRHLRAKYLLLLLDNCEHLAACASDVAALLEACPRLQVLATSRAPLHVPGERLVPVPPLMVPSLAPLPALPALARTPAVALFVQRAHDADAQFVLTPATAPAVAAICTRLEGLPLAIELAAAKVRVLPPPALLARLERQLPLLTSGAPSTALSGAPALEQRHQTMRNTLAWSEALLAPADQRLFRRLAVFAGGFTLEAAEAICATPEGAEPLGVAVVDGLERLVDQSLLEPWAVDSVERQSVEGDGKAAVGEGEEEQERSGDARFRLLHVVREYALERLEASDGGHEAEALRRAHAVYFLELLEKRAFAAWGPKPAAWMRRLEQEHDDVRAALGWARAGGEVELGLRLATSVAGFWYVRGYFTEGRGWLEGLLAQAPPVALGTAGLGSRAEGDVADTPGTLCVSAETRAMALSAASNLARVQGDDARALAAAAEALALTRDQQAAWADRAAGTSLHLLGQIAWDRGDLQRAISYLEDGVARLRAVGQDSMAASFLTLVGLIALEQGDLERARACCEESLAFARRTGADLPQGSALACLAHVARRQGDLARAEVLGRDELLIWRRLGTPLHIAGGLEGLARTITAAGEEARAARAARLLGAAEVLRERVNVSPSPRDRVNRERAAAEARLILGEAGWAAAYAAGQALSADEAITEALS